VHLFEQLHKDWQEALVEHKNLIQKIESKIGEGEVVPPKDLIFRALSQSIASTKVVIFGQDPYPTPGHAHGLAFSVDSTVAPLPASLRNIFKELESDVGIKRGSGDLTDWSNQGVMLINRSLTTQPGISLAHRKFGWELVTETVAKVLGERDVVAVLWGGYAIELKPYFREDFIVSSVHPSPLSAYRGFFGSQPFSQVNSKLIANGIDPIAW
jgi:uracil-DNA glycosylase